MTSIKRFILLFIIIYGPYVLAQNVTSAKRDTLNSIFKKSVKSLESYNYKDAIKYSSRLIDLSTLYKDDYHEFLGYDLLGTVYRKIDDSISAKANAEKALQIALECKSDSLISWSYVNLGVIYSENENTKDKGIVFFEKSVALNEKLKNEEEVYLIYINLAWSYLDLNQEDEAFKILKKANSISGNPKISRLNKEFIRFLFGRYHYQKKNYRLAKKKLISVAAVADQKAFHDLGGEVYNFLTKLYFDTGDYKNAYLSLEKTNYHDEKIFDAEKLEATEIASAKFNIREYQKDLDVALKKKKLSDELFKKTNQIKTAFIITTFVLLFALIAFFLLLNSRHKYVNKLQTKNIELTEAKEKAERLSKVKSKFFSTVSHELRTPLYGVIGISSILQEDKKLSEYTKDLNSLKFSADYLLALINDVLLLNKMDAEALKLEETPFQLNVLINSIIKSFEFSLEQNNNKLSVNIDNKVPNFLIGDSIRISQILMNLIGNAIKFNENGNVWLDVQYVEVTDEGKYKTKFIIKDDGIGIPEEKQEVIFEEFNQVVNENYSYKGTGLGLPIVKKLLDLYESDIYLKSDLGKGSEFSFFLDFKKNGNLKENMSNKSIDVIECTSENLNRDIHILVVDDNKINQKITQRILEKHYFTSSTANDGEEAILMIKEHDYDLVLMDINMPKMTGIEATLEVRKFNSKIPIIALTAVEVKEMRIKIFNSGMNDIIPKPYDVSQFLSTILKNLAK
ncbi:hypothetical protein A8C32_19225 [Flavivirga aquatica]|uniref:histidine kinase n=1 Tax=Flavivirga aquatica TaxID=1849968 RepID=A0A1E5T442_9FLAO|nr:response regulator [Flavivirga aquatica]OEK06163.1 hypothetical protein A8C32_19225 [Flavivirga aquatica]